MFSIVRNVYLLAGALEQDCIAVFYPSRDSGLLLGPRADKWGAFDADFFFRGAAERLAA